MAKLLTTSQAGAKVKRLAKKMGCTFESPINRYEVIAPDGMVFVVNDAHTVIAWHMDVNTYKKEAYEQLLKDLQYGLRTCTDPDCEMCNQKKE